jgi:hypothetical protein
VKILQIIPAPGWCAVYARRVETGELELWTEPLIAWALVEEAFEDDEGDDAAIVEQHVVGLVNWGVQGPTVATETAGFVLTYVQAQEDLEPHRAMAETLIMSWERRDRDDLDQQLPRN